MKITRENKEFVYHFHSGVYRALAEREGFHPADLTPPPQPHHRHGRNKDVVRTTS